MYVLRVPETKCLLVVPDKEAEALVTNWLENGKKVLETGVRYVVKPGEVLGIDGLQIKTFVLDGNRFSVIAHPDPSGRGISGYLVHGGAERVNVAGGGPEVDVTDRVEPE